MPVSEVLGPLGGHLRERNSAVLVAPPGAGKTTVVPLALRDEDWLGGRKILVLEPRRLATRAAAARMAATLGERVGESVGYRIRQDTRVSPRTRIEVVTEGVLTRMLQSDPALDELGLIIFDEFHERSIHSDLGLALTLESQRLFRDDLRVLVMSATLDTGPVAGLLDDAPVVRAEGRQYPVETHYLDRRLDDPVAGTAARVRSAIRQTAGDVLVFLPGAGEIRRVAADLENELPPDVDQHPLFDNLGASEQDAAVAPSPVGRRKIVLATAIAQTSLTIEGVRVVVDAGLMRVPRFDPGSGMQRLITVPVTVDVAEQRRGRAGRVAPGVCYRLWTEGQRHALLPALRPEILEADLASLVLELAAWGATVAEVRWIDAPPAAGVVAARDLLIGLDALDADGGITAHGRELARIGAHPRLAHLLVAARARGLGAMAADVAALAGERDILQRDGAPADSDMRLRLEALERARARTRGGVLGHRVHRGGLHRVLEDSRRWRRCRSPESARGDTGAAAEAGELLALAYPDRVGRRRGNATAGHGARYLLRNGRGAALPRGDSLGESEWIVVADLGEREGEARIFRAAPIEWETVRELFEGQVQTVEETGWNPETEAAESWRIERLGAIELKRVRIEKPDPEHITAGLLAGVRAHGLSALPWSKRTSQLRERLAFAHQSQPAGWPDVSDVVLLDSLEQWLAPHLVSMHRLADLRRLDVTTILWTLAGWEKREYLDEIAPTHLEVPSGSRIPVDYSDPGTPTLAVRLQEVFGWLETPRIGGGTVPITLSLLSPAQRPAQVTRDLASFWREGYFEVKKDLKGRYPKHYWPDDPLTATPTRRVRPK
ncbi:MAG: ATP-dependent helicase HrpB [Acidobacteria bacterium]|nr:ATP-dependent helicase HrpB [Acidobacteriota bacterium]